MPGATRQRASATRPPHGVQLEAGVLQPVGVGYVARRADDHVGLQDRIPAAHTVLIEYVDAVRCDPDLYAVVTGGCDGEIGQPRPEQPEQWREEVDDGDLQAECAAGAGDLHAKEAASQHDRTAGRGQPGGEGRGVVQGAHHQIAVAGESAGPGTSGDHQPVVRHAGAVGRCHQTAVRVEPRCP